MRQKAHRGTCTCLVISITGVTSAITHEISRFPSFSPLVGMHSSRQRVGSMETHTKGLGDVNAKQKKEKMKNKGGENMLVGKTSIITSETTSYQWLFSPWRNHYTIENTQLSVCTCIRVQLGALSWQKKIFTLSLLFFHLKKKLILESRWPAFATLDLVSMNGTLVRIQASSWAEDRR